MTAHGSCVILLLDKLNFLTQLNLNGGNIEIVSHKVIGKKVCVTTASFGAAVAYHGL